MARRHLVALALLAVATSAATVVTATARSPTTIPRGVRPACRELRAMVRAADAGGDVATVDTDAGATATARTAATEQSVQATTLAVTQRIPVRGWMGVISCKRLVGACPQTLRRAMDLHPALRRQCADLPRRDFIGGAVVAAAQQLRARKDVLKQAIFKQTGVVPQAVDDAWTCGHSSGRGPGCFVKIITGPFKSLKNTAACFSCIKEITDKEEEGTEPASVMVQGAPVKITGKWVKTASKCAQCAKALAVKCGGKLWGIGSKRKATGCKLIKSGGCFPKTSDRVIHDCGENARCAYKLTSAKAKIWCCRKRGWGKCSWRARSKAKDRNGAVILYKH